MLFLFLFFAAQTHAMGKGPIKAAHTFETKDLSQWSLKRLPGRKDAKISTKVVRAGKYSVKVGLAPGVRYKDGWKNELSDYYFPHFNREIWYRVSHYLPDEFDPLPGNRCMLAQWHDTGPIGFSPLLGHRYQDGRLEVTIAYGKTDEPLSYRDVANFVFFTIPKFSHNRWHDFVYRAYWPRGGQGYIEAWYNGKYVGKYRGKIGYKNEATGPYFKTGVYCEQSPHKTISAYVDEYRRGARKEDVLLPGETLQRPR
jgi:hypothetical protein